MFKTLKIALVSMLALATPALAEAPWELPAPKMSQGQRDGLAQLHKVLVANNRTDPGRSASELGFEYNFVHKAPISNISGPDMLKLLDRKYFIYSFKGMTPKSPDLIEIAYFQGGDAYICENFNGAFNGKTGGAWTVKKFKMQSLQNFSGFAGYGTFKAKPGDWGYPAIYDPSTGDFAVHIMLPVPDKKRVWDIEAGHIQADYAPVFAEICPGMPKSGTINENQTAKDYATFRKQTGNSATKNGAPVIYKANVRAPLTLAMYYSAFPPKQ